MKPLNRFSLLLTVLIMATQLTAQWTLIPSGTTHHLRDVHFPTDSIGYIVGDYGSVLQSTDRGATWQKVFQDSTINIVSVFFISADTGFAAASDLLKTTDGGQSWTKVMSEPLTYFTEVYFVNHKVGFAGGNALYRTTDAGLTWDSMPWNGPFSSIYFPGDSVGYFTGGTGPGDPLYRTDDLGNSMTQITNDWQSIKEAVHFLDNTTGYICGWYGGLLAKTTDGGINWTMVDEKVDHQCWDVYFTDEQNGYYINNGGGEYIIWYTSDGGSTWMPQLDAEVHLTEMRFLDNETAIVVGYEGTIYKTGSGGGTVGIKHQPDPSNISVYPNPAGEIVHVRFDSRNVNDHSLTIFTLQGKEIKAVNSKEAETEINISELPSGVYLLVIEDANGERFTKKLMKK